MDFTGLQSFKNSSKANIGNGIPNSYKMNKGKF
jgi:hypothetical protein